MRAAQDAVQKLNGSLLHGKFPLLVVEAQYSPVGAKEHLGSALDKQLSVDKYVPRVCI